MKKSSLYNKILVAGIVLMSLGSCTCADTNKYKKEKVAENEPITYLGAIEKEHHTNRAVKRAVAHINPLKDNPVEGKVTFEKVESGVLVVADIKGLTPGKHGFHIHEYGDCTKSGTAVGAHYNPADQKHGGPESSERHAGDLGNLFADAQGNAHYERIDSLIKLEGRQAIIGRSIIIHADKDDFVSQPAGASGEKIACGVIEAVSE